MPDTDRGRILRFRDSPQVEPMPIQGSPFARPMKPHVLRIDMQAETILLRFDVGAEYVAARDALQGGAVATMLDMTLVFLSIAMTPENTGSATVSLHLHYLRPARTGRYLAQAQIERAGRTLVYAHGHVYPEGESPVATASGVFAVLQPSSARPGA